jgi:5'(3')-deoxyribonucleotidase
MRIGVDVDGVLADLSNAACNVWNDWHPDKPMRYEDWKSWDMYLFWNMGKREFYRMLDTAWLRWGSMPLMEPDVAKTMLKLRARHYVHIITSRSRGTHAYVAAWLDENHIYYDALTFIEGHEKFSMPIDVLIDDNPWQVNQVPADKILYLRDHLWNSGLGGERVERVGSLQEALDSIDAR